MKNAFFFDAMLTPKIIVLLYWGGMIGVVVGALFNLFSGGDIWISLAILIGGLIGTRMWCELMIVLFKINENLQRVASRQ
ncbi:DUF4282 domain-containing protein [Stutzerimonas urumqiensis]|uniref:DUF4282 domain-containing protein n=1 Tax=Stutzerimonas urumqiensis TaxID=638269 RepID=UPI003BA8B88E